MEQFPTIMENETQNMNGVRKVIENLKTKFSLISYTLRPKNKIVGGILSIFILSAAIGTGVYLVQLVQQTRTKAGGVTLSLSTGNANPKVGDTISVAVAIDTGGVAVNGADLRVVYDTSVLDFQSITNGNFLTTVLIPSYSFSIPNTTNKAVVFVLGSDPGVPKTGNGLLAQLTFKVKTTSKTAITIGPATAVSASGQKTNALGTTTPVQINGASSSTTPTATPSGPVPTITGGSVVTAYNPWAVSLQGTGFTATLKARLIDLNGSQWGSDITLGTNTTSKAFFLPSNVPPSGCNVGKTCVIGVYLVTSTGGLSNKWNLTLPATSASSTTPTPTAVPTIPATPSCLSQGTSCTGPSDARCCAPWGCDLKPKSGGQYFCGIPVE